MKFVTPPPEELRLLRRDPLLWEQELDVRPDVAEDIERAVGTRAGRVYWRSDHDHLYALELTHTGGARPSMATVFGYWERYEPRPPEREIDIDLLAAMRWIASVSTSLQEEDVRRVAHYGSIPGPHQKGDILQTPADRFVELPGFPYEPRYTEVEEMRMAHVEHGSGDPILMLHGEPTWGYLYRKMIPPLAEAGRCVVPDLIGFGRSDKPTADNAYRYATHVRWMRSWITSLDLQNITLICQDWGGSIGLRVLAQMPHRFQRVVAMHTGIADGRGWSPAFLTWRRASQRMREMDVPRLMRRSLQITLSDAEAAAYGAPFPTSEYQMGALTFPRLVPIRPDTLAAYDNRAAIDVLKTLEIPALLLWGDSDPITAPNRQHLASIFRQVTHSEPIPHAGHFIQEDAGPEVARRILAWMHPG